MNILIVEDEAIVAMDIEGKLIEMGYTIVGIADNYADAIKIAENNTIDLALLDINIQGDKTGIDIAFYLKTKFELPCIFLSAFSNNTIINQAKMVGAYGYVLKPFTSKDLYTNIEIAQIKFSLDKELQNKKKELEHLVSEKTKSLMEANLKLVEEVKSRKKVQNNLLKAEEKERKRIAMELHDGLSQTLTAIKFNLGAVAKSKSMPKDELEIVTASLKMLENTMREVREISQDLRPSIIDDFGLEAAIENLCTNAKFQACKINFTTKGRIPINEKHIEASFYRIAQEALNNALKYSKATKIELILAGENDSICMEIIDNGAGFDSLNNKGNQENKDNTGSGLKNIAERCNFINASCEIVSVFNKGTKIKVCFKI